MNERARWQGRPGFPATLVRRWPGGWRTAGRGGRRRRCTPGRPAAGQAPARRGARPAPAGGRCAGGAVGLGLRPVSIESHKRLLSFPFPRGMPWGKCCPHHASMPPRSVLRRKVWGRKSPGSPSTCKLPTRLGGLPLDKTLGIPREANALKRGTKKKCLFETKKTHVIYQ